MSEQPHARPGSPHYSNLSGHEAVSPVSTGYSVSGPPLSRIQHSELDTNGQQLFPVVARI